MKHRASLGYVDLVTAEHGIDTSAQPDGVSQIDQQPKALAGDAVLRIVQVEALGFQRQTLSPLGILSKQCTQMETLDLLMMLFEGLPGRQLHQRNLVSTHGRTS